MEFSAMAATASYITPTKVSMPSRMGNNRAKFVKRRAFFVSAQQQDQEAQTQEAPSQEQGEEKVKQKGRTVPRPVEVQENVKSKGLSREDGGQWLSSVTRHVRIFAAYVDPVTWEFDQSQTDKLTLILDPTNEFVWNPDSVTKVYSYFQELVDHYEGADLTEYTLRLIGSDIEHYIRKMLFEGEITYNMDARVLNFSMGKPRIMFNNEIDQS